MVQFTKVMADQAIVATASQQLSWSHFQPLLPIKDPLARDFYAVMCPIERWNVRTLRQKNGGMLFSSSTPHCQTPTKSLQQKLPCQPA